MKKYIILIHGLALMFSYSYETYGQSSYKKSRSNFSIIPRFGISNDRKTGDNFKNYFSTGLRKEFSLGKLISLNAIADYNWSQGKLLNSNLRTLNVGGGVTVYPRYLIYLVLGKTYDEEIAQKDHIYFDESVSTNLNNSGYGNAGKIGTFKFEININQYYLSNKLSLSPKLGINANTFTNNFPQFNNDTVSFIYLGLALNLGSFVKAK